MIFRDWEHFWREGNHGYSSASREDAKELWDLFEPTINATKDDYKKAYLQLCKEKMEVKSEMQDAMLSYIEKFAKPGSPTFWRWWLDQIDIETNNGESVEPYEANENPHLVAMIGLPCSGKTTYRKEHYPDYTVVSWDKIIEDLYPDKTYNEAFELSKPKYKETEKIYFQTLENALQANENIVVDMTLLDCKSRSKRLVGIPDKYRMTAVVCQTSEKKFHERNTERSKKGKTIPDDVYSNMSKRFQMPTEDEGFGEIIRNLT